MTSPIIGITVSQIKSKNRRQNFNPSAYAQAVVQAGGTPLLIPNEFPISEIPVLFKKIDGLLLSGGGDIDPILYHGTPHPKISGISADRDRLEFALLDQAINNNKPVFGICRGLQVINVFLGGTLYSDLPDQRPSEIQHSTPDDLNRDFLAHEVQVNLQSRLGNILQRERILVNSFHHQAIFKPASDLVVTAHATDGLIEAIELPGDNYRLMAVQWHPEDLTSHVKQLQLFKSFILATQ